MSALRATVGLLFVYARMSMKLMEIRILAVSLEFQSVPNWFLEAEVK